MIAATAFGNVMKKRGDIQQPWFVPACGQLRAKRVLMRMLSHEKPAHIAQYHQNVLVHRVGMEQVMLHLTHDAAKDPQVTA